MKKGSAPGTVRAGEEGLLSFFGRWPGWAIGAGIALVLGGSAVYAGLALTKRPQVTVTSNAQHCVNQPTKLASLFSDGQTTMIRLSNPDLTNMQILRTEPANVLPGMFEALMSLSADNTHLAYVTADDEILDNAHIEYIDPTNPSSRIDLASVPKGLWTVQPAWSGDDKKLAFVTLDQSGSALGQYELMVADTSTQPATVGIQADLIADNFTNGHSATICWTKDNRVVMVPSVPLAVPTSAPTPGHTPTASASPVTGSPCGVPIFSQNDPAWQSLVMQSGADTIGKAGCAMTSAAMMLNYYGSTLTPAQLNTCLAGNADPLAWKSVPSCTNGLISGGDKIDFTWTDLDALLAAGRPAIVGMLGGQQGSHFVVVTQGGGGVADSYRITDPWDATTYKTLGGYINDGYTPAWIISFTGAGHNCARLIKGVVPAIPSVPNATTTPNPVTLNINPTLLKNLKFLGIQKLSGGTIPKDIISQPLPFTKITNGTTITDEGIYQVLVTTQAPSQPPHSQLYKFTIDKTPPSVDLTLLNPKTSGDSERSLGTDGTVPTVLPQSYPLMNKPAQLQVASSDTLSGLKDIKYSLDGAALTDYSSDNSFNRVLLVDACGDHSFRIQAFDAAGNKADVTKYFTVYCYVAPKPTPTPPPPPPPSCPSKLTLGSFTASYVPASNFVAVSWKSNGGCSPYTGVITVTYPPGVMQPRTHSINDQPSGSWQDANTGCPFPTTMTMTYSLTMRDKFGQTINGTATASCP